MAEDNETPVSTANDFIMGWNGETMGFMLPVDISTKQQGYRTIAWIETLLRFMPDEPGNHTMEQVREAVSNT